MFSDALDLILKFEGGYSNDSDDPGGATNFGITQNVYDPTHTKNVKDITPEEVSNIYENQYWKEGKCDIINTISSILATIHFDNCVNCGTGGAARMLQSVLGVEVDGIIGTKTLTKINDSFLLKKLYLDRRKTYYDSIIQRNPRLIKFRSSWIHRLNKLSQLFNGPTYE